MDGTCEFHLQTILFLFKGKKREEPETSINVSYPKTMTLSNCCH